MSVDAVDRSHDSPIPTLEDVLARCPVRGVELGPLGQVMPQVLERCPQALMSQVGEADQLLDWTENGPVPASVGHQPVYRDRSARQVWEVTTILAMDLAARSASFRDVPLARLRRSHLEAWVKAMDSAGLAPGTIKTRLVNVRTVLRAAVRDRVIASDPATGSQDPQDGAETPPWSCRA